MNRGVDKRSIAADDRDRKRFVVNLYAANNTAPIDNMNYYFAKSMDLRGPYYIHEKRERLVNVHAWCLMGNHYHMLLSERVEGGLSKFLMKCNVAYTKYFNERHARSGVLFQGKTKRVLITTERQYLYILPYIHLNPLDLSKSTAAWRTQCLANPKAALEQIETYRWSSYRNYADEAEFSEILEGSPFFKYRADHVAELHRYIKTAPDPELTALNLE